MVLSPHIYPCPDSPPSPLSPTGGKGRGGRGGGAGLPLGTAVAQSISPKPRNFLLPKRKKKKKIPAATFPPCPIGTVETGSVGFPGRVAQGWNTLRQEWWSSLSGPPPGPLWALPSPLLLPLQANHQRWPSPDLRPLGWRPGRLGAGAGVLRSPKAGGAGRLGMGLWPPSTLYPLPPFPRAGHFLPQAAVGTFVPLLKKSVPSSPTPSWVEGGADPRAGGGEGTAGQMGSSAPRGPPGLLVSGTGTLGILRSGRAFV